MSSRNMRLSENEKEDAVNISKALFESKERMHEFSVAQTIENVLSRINGIDSLESEYFEIVDGDTLLPVANWTDSDYIVGCVIAFCGQVRLIDNIIYKTKY